MTCLLAAGISTIQAACTEIELADEDIRRPFSPGQGYEVPYAIEEFGESLLETDGSEGGHNVGVELGEVPGHILSSRDSLKQAMDFGPSLRAAVQSVLIREMEARKLHASR